MVTGVSPGTVTITLSAAGNTNYNAGSATKTITVTKINQSPSISGSDSVVYGSSITLSGSGQGGLSWSSSNTGVATVNSSGVVTGVSPGTVTITLSAAGNTYYNPASVTKTITVTRANQTPSISGSSSVAYGSSITLSGSGQGGLSWSSSNTGVATVNSSGVVTGVSPGTVTITLSAAGNTYYNPATATKTITVTKASQSTPTISGVEAVIYGGSITLTASGGSTGNYVWGIDSTTGGATASLSATSGGSVTLTGTRAGGTVVVRLYAEYNGYYLASSPTYKTITIDKATYNMSGAKWDYISAFTYDGTYKTVSVTGLPSGVSVGSYSGNSEINVGDYTASATLSYDSINYNAPSIGNLSWSITPKDIATVTLTAPADVTYNGSTQHSKPTLKLGAATLAEGTDYTLSFSADCVNVGDKTVTVTGAGNYTGTATTGFTINKAALTIGISYGTVTYGTNSAEPEITGNSGNGEISFAVAAGTGSATVDALTGVLSPTLPGTVSVTVTVGETDNYLGGSKTETVTINKITPTATVGVLTGYYYVGDTIAGIIISVSESSVSGSVVWTDPDTVIMGTDDSYSWTFTPDDTTYYAEITGEIEVAAYYKLTGIALSGEKTEYKAYDTFDTSGLTVTASYATGKDDTAVTGYEVIYPTAGLMYLIVADDGKSVTVRYNENGKTATATVQITVGKKDYDLTGVSMPDQNIGYDAEYHKGAIVGSLPEGVRLTGYTYDGVSSAQGVKKVGVYAVAAVFSISDPDNYNMPALSAKITITKATPTAEASVLAGTYYVGDSLSGVTISVGDSSVPGTIRWTNPSAVLTGTANSYGWTFTPDDTDNYNVATGNVQVIAYYKLTGITLSGGKTEYKAYDTFDTSGLTVTASYASGKTDTEVTGYEIIYPTAGLSYFIAADNNKYVTISYTESGITKTATLQISVGKKDYDLTGVSMDDVTVTYDGEVHSVTYTGVLPSGVYVDGYLYNGKQAAYAMNAGEYTVEARIRIADGANYNMPELSATLTINKARPTAEASVLEGDYYLGDKLSSVTISVGDSSVAGKIAWTNANATITSANGRYGWTFTPDDTDNYFTATGSVTVTAYYKLTGITVSGAKTMYKAFESFDTAGMTVTASYAAGKTDTVVTDYEIFYPTAGLDHFLITDDYKDLIISYTESGITKTANVTIVIDANEYDMTGVTMDNVTVDYDGYNHTITYSGTLPDGVKVVGYKYDGEDNAIGKKLVGEYKVEAVFEIDDPDNYKLPRLSAILTINKATPTATANIMDGYYYVGGKLSDVYIDIGDSSVAGAIAWTNGNTLIMGESGTYSWTFTPDDTDNYKTVTGTVSVPAYYKLASIIVTGAKTTYKAHESFDTTGLTVTASYEAGKASAAVTGYDIIYPAGGRDYFLTVDDGKNLTISYTEGGITKTATVTIVIDANSYDMTGVSMDDLTVDYDGEFHTITYTGTLPEGVTLTGFTYNGVESADGVKDAGTYKVDAVFDIADPENYKPPRLSATITINKATPTAEASVLAGIYYVGDTLSTVTVSVGDSSVTGTIAWTNANAVITGTASSYGWTFTPDDNDNYKAITGTAQVAACYKLTGITLSGAKNLYKPYEAFETEGLTVTASYLAGKADTAVEDYFITYPTAGATYFVITDDGKELTVTYMENGITATATVTIVIDALEYDMTGVRLGNKTVVYDDTYHTLSLTGTLPDGVRITGYAYNGVESAQGVKDVGIYEVEAVFEIDDPDNYKLPKLSAILVINKATPAATASVPDGYYFVGDKLSTVTVEVGSSSVSGTIEWTNANAIITSTGGSYGWTFTPDDTDNYKTVTGRVQVVADYKLTGITVSGAKTTYKARESFDTTGMTVVASYAVGKPKTAVTGYTYEYPTAGATSFVIADDGKAVVISYTENGITVTAKVTISIQANEYDMKGVSMDNVTVGYDGGFHTIAYTGTLPDGVRVSGYTYNGEYSADGVKNVGVYTVEAIIEIDDPDNYKMPKLSATLTINKGTPNVTGQIISEYCYVGDYLSSVDLGIGEADVLGVIVWTNENAVITGVSGSYSWTFIPNDEDNYKRVTGSVQITACYKLTGISVTGEKLTYKAHESFDTTGMTVTASYAAGKPKTAVTGYTYEYPTAGATSFVVADDGKAIVISYTENGITVTASLTITIEANEYDMTGVSMDNATVDYDGDFHVLSYAGTLPDGVTLIGYTYNGESSANGVKKAGTYKVEAVFEIDDPDNYKMPKLSATLTINKATPTATANVLNVYYYVGEELSSVYITVGESSVSGAIAWTNPSALITGVSGSYGWTFTPDDTDNYKQITGTAQVTAYFKLAGITVSGAKTVYRPYDTFDTTGMTVIASYETGKADAVVTDYEISYPTDGLQYFLISDDGKQITVTYIENGITATATVTVKIEANEYDMTGVSMSDVTVDYDGNFHTIELTGTLPVGVTLIGYTYNGEGSESGVVNAGTYKVEAVFKIADPDSYKMPVLSATLTINKAKTTATVAVADGYYFIGDGLSTVKLTVAESSVSGTIAWANPSAVIMGMTGSYNWTFTPDDTDNYEVCTGRIQVKANYKLTGLILIGANDFYKPNESFKTSGLTVLARYMGKKDTVVTDYEITYPTAGSDHFLISDDGKDLVISYTENGITVTAKVTIVIDAEEYDMSGVSMQDKTLTYDGAFHTIELTGTLPDGVTLIGYTYNGEANSQGVVNAGNYKVEAVFEIDKPDTFKMPRLSATLTINKIATTATVVVPDGVYFVGDALSTVKISVGESSISGTVSWTDPSAVIGGALGSYGWTFTPDDAVNYETFTGVAQITAHFKLTGITVSGAKTVYKPYESFDPTGMTVTASYAMGKADTVVDNYFITYPTSSLQHFVISDDGKSLIITYIENGIKVKANVTIEIDANRYDMSGVRMNNLAVDYDGEFHSLTLTGTLPDGVTLIGYTYNGEDNDGGVKNAGTYLVEAVFSIADPDNYKMPELSATLLISKAASNITVPDNTGEYTYDGTLQTVDLGATVDNTEQQIKYSNNTFTDVPEGGRLEITVFVEESDNYLAASKTVTVTVNKATATLDVSGVETDYVYNGSLQTVDSGATVDNTEQEVKYSNNTFTDVPAGGALNVNVYVEESKNYLAASETVVISVDKAKVENIVTFTDKTVTYDGATHTLTVEGELTGVSVEYYYNGTAFNGATDVRYDGENVVGYEIVARFTVSDNYYDPADMTATLTINPYTLSDSDVTDILGEYGYTGATQKPAPTVTVTLADGALTLDKQYYTVSYDTEDYTVGTEVTVTVTADYNGNVKGAVDKVFVITKATLEVAWGESATVYVYDGTRQGVTVTGVTGFAAADAATPYTVTYTGRGGTAYSSALRPMNAGQYTVTVSFDGSVFDNYKLASDNALSKQFEIRKADVTATVKAEPYDTLYEGGALPALILDGEATSGSLKVFGKLTWQTVGGEPPALELYKHTYTWVFTPNDSGNFNVLTGEMTFNAEQNTVTSITVAWRTDIEIPVIYTSTTLTEIRNYVTVKGRFDGGKEIEISGYQITGDWGSTLSPDTDDEGPHDLTFTFKSLPATLKNVYYKPISVDRIKVEAATPDGITTEYKGLDLFDRNSIIVIVVYSDGTERRDVKDYTIVYSNGHEELWVGDESVSVYYDNGTSSPEPVVIDGLTVTPKSYDPSEITVEDFVTDYDGTAKAYTIKGEFKIGKVIYTYQQENADGDMVTVLPSNVKNAGKYQVTVRFELEGKYAENYYDDIATRHVNLIINKIDYEGVDAIAFETTEFDYDFGNSLAGKVADSLKNVPDGVKVTFEYSGANGAITADEVVNAGDYFVTVRFEEDGNHYGIDPIVGVKFKVAKVTPAVDPSIGGSLAAGTELSQLSFVGNLGGASGTFTWVNGEQKLQNGKNRCYFVFTPDDAVNYETVTSYIDLEIEAGGAGEVIAQGGIIPDWATYTIIGVAAAAMVAAIIAIIAAARKKAPVDDDGFNDPVTEDYLEQLG